MLILPAVPYGVADHHGGFPGTISIGYDGLYCIVSKIVEKLYGYGVRRFIFLNGHGGNNPVLQHIGIDLNGRGAVSAIVNWWQIAGQLNPDWKGGHGGAEERRPCWRLIRIASIWRIISHCSHRIYPTRFGVRECLRWNWMAWR